METYQITWYNGKEERVTILELFEKYYHQLPKFGVSNSSRIISTRRFYDNYDYYTNYVNIDGIRYTHFTFIDMKVILYESIGIIYSGLGKPIDVHTLIDVYFKYRRKKNTPFYKKQRHSKRHCVRYGCNISVNGFREWYNEPIDFDNEDEPINHRIVLRNRHKSSFDVISSVLYDYDYCYSSGKISKSWKDQSKRKTQWKEHIEKY